MKIFFCALTVIFLSVFSCQNQSPGERLAKQTCSSCHLLPDPSVLDKKTWNKEVFPEMAFRMGLDNSPLNNVSFEDHSIILRSLPDNPMVSAEEWELIKKYYTENAPDSLVIPDRIIDDTLKLFQARTMQLSIEKESSITLISHDSTHDKIYVGNRPAKLYEFNRNFEIQDSFKLQSPPSQLVNMEDGNPMILQMGIMDPNEQSAGSITVLDRKNSAFHKIIDSLQRPVEFERVDFNNDKAIDFVTCNFGHITGSLTVFEALPNGKFKRYWLANTSGARRTIVKDFDNNGLPDILVLMTQGDERVLLFYNLGNFQFRMTTLLRFDAVQGSSYIETADFNNDGKFDILHTSGDNADYSFILKPFHGVRIFLNNGTNEFKESWFYPMHGASQARVADFDKDGDLDIAAISFFPDFKKHPDHSFIYLENENGTYKPQITRLASKGRWLTMTVCDYDKDGDTDILLGSLTFPTNVPRELFQQWNKNPVSLMILENKLGKVASF